MLFENDRHEPLIDNRWDERVARDTILDIAEDARAAFSRKAFWPIHLFDVSLERATTLKPIYYGRRAPSGLSTIWQAEGRFRVTMITHIVSRRCSKHTEPIV